MSKEIMTAEEYRKHIGNNVGTVGGIDRFAKAYARYVIESLTDEEITETMNMRVKGSKMTIGKRRGAKWARQELLNRIK